MWKVLISSLNYFIRCSVSTYYSFTLTSSTQCTFFSTWFFHFHFSSCRNLLNVFNSVISVQLIIFLIAVFFTYAEPLTCKSFSLHLCDTLTIMKYMHFIPFFNTQGIHLFVYNSPFTSQFPNLQSKTCQRNSLSHKKI
jgi:hypothetical protein